METFTTRQVSETFEVSESTVRNWANEFTLHLSPDAGAAQGRSRQYTLDDMEVFALIAEMKGSGKTYADIHASLSNGQRGTVPDLPPPALSAATLLAEVTRLRDNLVSVEKERDDLKAQVDELRLKVARLETEGEMKEKLGRALGELEALKRMMEKGS